jgi:hypothetical protein
MLFKHNTKSIKNISHQSNYLLNLLDHITDHDFTYIPWYSLSTWVNEQEKNQNVQMKMIMTLTPIMKLS